MVGPNPFGSIIKIAVSCQPSAVSKYNFKIFDINGKLINELTTDSRKLTAYYSWNGSVYPPGIYFLSAKIGNKTIQKKLIHIQ
jgi:hypothetical protein